MNLQCKIGLAAFPWKAIILTDNGKRLISWYLNVKAFVQAAEESTKIWANVQSKRKTQEILSKKLITRFLRQIELVKTNEMVVVWQS